MGEETLTIDRLIERARGDPEALGDLLERYRPYLLLTSRRQINPRVAVRCSPSDIVQETFAEAVHGFEGFCGSVEAEFSAWLARIHQHKLDAAARKHLLAKKRDAAREERLYGPEGSASFAWRDVAADEPTPSDLVVAGEKALRLAEVLLTLPDGQREAVCLRHLEGLSLKEIASQMDRSLPSAAGLLKRGLIALEQKMSKHSWV
jgi:RNA polymerase sigma-70 factor (ECF subfamily)